MENMIKLLAEKISFPSKSTMLTVAARMMCFLRPFSFFNATMKWFQVVQITAVVNYPFQHPKSAVLIDSTQ